jgi:nucleotidyltransferase/DNA polymerase involved in DNA repair
MPADTSATTRKPISPYNSTGKGEEYVATHSSYRAFLLSAEAANPAQVRSEEMILDLCRRGAHRVEILGRGAMLLDLGVSRADEARSLIDTLLSYLGDNGVTAGAGIGPTGIIAQLALARKRNSKRPVPLVSIEEKSTFLHNVPTRLLSELYPRGIISLDLLVRLEHYGLRTFGQIALLPQSLLCRQFGMTVGTFLAAIAIGNDPGPGKPARRRMSHGLLLRFTTPTSPEGLLATLPYLSRSAAALLEKHRLLTNRLRIRLGWAGNKAEQVSITLRRPTADSRLLAEELKKLALQLLTSRSAKLASGAGEVEALQLFLEDEVPAKPAQQLLWKGRQGIVESRDQHQREQKLAVLQTISSTLAHRYGQIRTSGGPPLFHPRLALPDAIFPEERYSKVGIYD